jgi:hypothetical protein
LGNFGGDIKPVKQRLITINKESVARTFESLRKRQRLGSDGGIGVGITSVVN